MGKKNKEKDSLAKPPERLDLADRLADWPLLRLLVLHRGFRWVVISFVMAVIALALLLPKIWLVTPEGFRPRIKISLLDKLQAWSLKRKATEAMKQERMSEAVTAWRAAWGNDPGDLSTVRGLLESISQLTHPKTEVNLSLRGASWLLRLGHTNQNDIPLIGWTWIRCGLSERALVALNLAKDNPPPRVETLRMIAALESGQIRTFAEKFFKDETFRKRVIAAAGKPDNVSDPVEREFRVVSLAFIAGWGTDAAARKTALKELQAAQKDPATETVAYDLDYLIRLAHHDVEGCRRLLAQLTEIGKDTIRHHTAFWRLLISEGRRAEALELATSANLVPTSAWDAYQLARAFTLLGRLDAANKLLRGYSRNIGWMVESLLLRADILMRQAGIIPDPNVKVMDRTGTGINEDPLSELSTLALTIRMQPDAMDILGGYSYYLEGMAEWYQGDREAAARAFEKAAEIGFRDPMLAVKVSKSLLAIGGAARWVEPILLKYQKVLGENEDYLTQLVKCEAQLKDDRYLLAATKKLYELDPTDPGRINNYAAALLIVREDPAKALTLTLQLLEHFPNHADLKINHAVALVLNGRFADALEVLSGVIPENLEPPEATQYYITAFEAYWKLGRFKRAEAALKKVERDLLYPAQVAWLDDVLPQFQADMDAAKQQ